MHSSRVPCNLVFASKLILSFCQFFPQFSQVLLETFLLLISFSHNFLTDWPRVFFHKTDSCLIHCLYSRVAVWPSCAFLYLSIPSHVSLSVYSCMCNCYVWYECICVNPSFLRPCPAWCWKQPLPGLAVSADDSLAGQWTLEVSLCLLYQGWDYRQVPGPSCFTRVLGTELRSFCLHNFSV